MKVIAVLFSLVILAGYPLCASAAFYRYYDENGGVNVTNDFKSIPERYRAGVTAITEKELERKAKSRERQEQPASGRAVQDHRHETRGGLPAQGAVAEPSPAAPAEQKENASIPDKVGSSWLSRQLPLLKVTGIVVLFIAGFIFAGKLISALAPRPLSIVIRIALFVALSVYLFKGYSEKIADSFARIKDEGNSAQKAVDRRSEKIQKQEE